MTIVDADELRAYMSDVGLTASQLDTADLVLAGVQGEIEAYLNRPLELRTVTETLYQDPYTGKYDEPSVTPVVSTTTLGAYVRNGSLAFDYVTLSSPVLVGSRGVTVTYVGGLDGVNIPQLKLEVLRIASREMANKHDDSFGINANDFTRQQPQVKPEALTDDDRKRLERWRRRTVL